MIDRICFSAARRFESARRLDWGTEQHRTRRVHGHSFLARLCAPVAGDIAGYPGGEVDLLRARLQAAVSHLDYRDLNEILDAPSDENLTRWLRARLDDIPEIDSLSVRSAVDRGAYLYASGLTHVWRRYRLEAAHYLPRVPPGHPCGRMHGHGFEVALHATRNPDTQRVDVDEDPFDVLWIPLERQLNFTCLNDVPGLENPTSEMLAGWIWERIKPQFEPLAWVSVYETVSAGCHYDGRRYGIWKDLRFESAVSQAHAPVGDPRTNVHGHSYVARVHVTAEVDEMLGWTVDYGDVKAIFRPILDILDHRRLDALDDLQPFGAPGLLRWMHARVAPVLDGLDRVELYETPGCGAIMHWGAHAERLPEDCR